ncbi:MAG: DoxX family membrane protein [Ignavibacteriae bacterium]|nr:DoxX family membrane protein [Ignavibacteriota bacterium]
MNYKQTISHITVFLFRVGVGVLFVVAGITKLADTKTFAQTIQEFGITGDSISNIISYTFPIIELITGVGMIVGLGIRYSSAITMLLLFIFIALIIPIIAVGKTVNCGCFGVMSSESVDVILLLRDGVLLAITLVVFNYRYHILSMDSFLFSVKE